MARPRDLTPYLHGVLAQPREDRRSILEAARPAAPSVFPTTLLPLQALSLTLGNKQPTGGVQRRQFFVSGAFVQLPVNQQEFR